MFDMVMCLSSAMDLVSTTLVDHQRRVAFIASGKAARGTQHAAWVWILNGKRITARDPMYLWNPEPGSYDLALEGVVRQIHFTVK